MFRSEVRTHLDKDVSCLAVSGVSVEVLRLDGRGRAKSRVPERNLGEVWRAEEELGGSGQGVETSEVERGIAAHSTGICVMHGQ